MVTVVELRPHISQFNNDRGMYVRERIAKILEAV
jgi:hypothetical protein